MTQAMQEQLRKAQNESSSSIIRNQKMLHRAKFFMLSLQALLVVAHPPRKGTYQECPRET